MVKENIKINYIIKMTCYLEKYLDFFFWFLFLNEFRYMKVLHQKKKTIKTKLIRIVECLNRQRISSRGEAERVQTRK